MVLFLKIVKRIIIFIVLTVLTQIGGLIYLFSIWLSKQIKKEFKLKFLLVFICSYSVATFLLIPVLSPVFGRVRLPVTRELGPVSYISLALNRNYVSAELKGLLENAAEDPRLKAHAIQVRYLDACFPFIDRFPLLPHLSHNDGEKVDLSFVYENTAGEIVNKSKSISGYGVFVEPKKGEFNQTEDCIKQGFFQYDYPKYLKLGAINNQLLFSVDGTSLLLKVILEDKAIGKLFVEKHLVKRMDISDDRLRFQGCGSVRHDDHIHLQLK